MSSEIIVPLVLVKKTDDTPPRFPGQSNACPVNNNIRSFGDNFTMFEVTDPEMLVHIPPDPYLRLEYEIEDPKETLINNVPEISCTGTNTDQVNVNSVGQFHREGGWPLHVDPLEIEERNRYCKILCRREGLMDAMAGMVPITMKCIRINGALDIYECLFGEEDDKSNATKGAIITEMETNIDSNYDDYASKSPVPCEVKDIPYNDLKVIHELHVSTKLALPSVLTLSAKELSLLAIQQCNPIGVSGEHLSRINSKVTKDKSSDHHSNEGSSVPQKVSADIDEVSTISNFGEPIGEEKLEELTAAAPLKGKEDTCSIDNVGVLGISSQQTRRVLCPVAINTVNRLGEDFATTYGIGNSVMRGSSMFDMHIHRRHSSNLLYPTTNHDNDTSNAGLAKEYQLIGTTATRAAFTCGSRSMDIVVVYCDGAVLPTPCRTEQRRLTSPYTSRSRRVSVEGVEKCTLTPRSSLYSIKKSKTNSDDESNENNENCGGGNTHNATSQKRGSRRDRDTLLTFLLPIENDPNPVIVTKSNFSTTQSFVNNDPVAVGAIWSGNDPSTPMNILLTKSLVKSNNMINKKMAEGFPHHYSLGTCDELQKRSNSVESIRQEPFIKKASGIGCTAMSPSYKDPHIIFGGLSNGVVEMWDTRSGPLPCSTSSRERSHRDAVTDIKLVPTKASEMFTCGLDGQVLFWDTRSLRNPIEEETVVLRDPVSGAALAATNIDFDPLVGGAMKYLVSTVEGKVLCCARRSRGVNASDNTNKIISTLSAHYGTCYMSMRCPALPKVFASCGDWAVNLFSDDLRHSILSGPPSYSTINSNNSGVGSPTEEYVTCGAWHPTRASVFMFGTGSGELCFIDYLKSTSEVVMRLKICSSSVVHIAPHVTGVRVAVTNSTGFVYLIALPDILVTPTINERANMVHALERECVRERLQEVRQHGTRERASSRYGSTTSISNYTEDWKSLQEYDAAPTTATGPIVRERRKVHMNYNDISEFSYSNPSVITDEVVVVDSSIHQHSRVIGLMQTSSSGLPPSSSVTVQSPRALSDITLGYLAEVGLVPPEKGTSEYSLPVEADLVSSAPPLYSYIGTTEKNTTRISQETDAEANQQSFLAKMQEAKDRRDKRHHDNLHHDNATSV